MSTAKDVFPMKLGKYEEGDRAVMCNGDVLTFCCNPIKGRDLRKILSNFTIIVYASFYQSDIWGTLPGVHLLSSFEDDRDPNWKPSQWDWFSPDKIDDDREYTLLSISIPTPPKSMWSSKLKDMRNKKRLEAIKQRNTLLKRLKRYHLQPTDVPTRKFY